MVKMWVRPASENRSSPLHRTSTSSVAVANRLELALSTASVISLLSRSHQQWQSERATTFDLADEGACSLSRHAIVGAAFDLADWRCRDGEGEGKRGATSLIHSWSHRSS